MVVKTGQDQLVVTMRSARTPIHITLNVFHLQPVPLVLFQQALPRAVLPLLHLHHRAQAVHPIVSMILKNISFMIMFFHRISERQSINHQ